MGETDLRSAIGTSSISVSAATHPYPPTNTRMKLSSFHHSRWGVLIPSR